jgi:tetratricopeptide (TPR) repeat protein
MMNPEKELILAWNYVLEGHYESAISLFERFLAHTTSPSPWNNYGTALLLNGDAKGAEKAFRRTRQLPNLRRLTTSDVGVSLWCQGKPEEACADWQQQLERLKTTEVRYYTASGLFLASLLWWASRQMDAPDRTQSALSEMRLLREWDDQKEEWGMILAAFLLGEITPDQILLEAAGRLDPDAQSLNFRQSRRTTQYFFYLAAHYPHHSEEWRANLNATVQYGMPQSIVKPEFHLARYELASG